jgi:nucleotide-binding universal stress UspA family protein
MFGTILLAVDEFEHSDAATEVARNLASATHDDVVVINVYRVHVGRPAPATYQTPEEAQKLVDRHVEAMTAAGVTAEGVLERHLGGTSVGEVLLAFARDRGAGLLVVGTRGRSDLAALTLGSVAHDVVHASNIPVLVVPGKDV